MRSIELFGGGGDGRWQTEIYYPPYLHCIA